MATVASIVATLGVDSAKFNQGLDKAGGRLKRFGGNAKKQFNAVGAAFGALTAVLGTKELLENADAMIKSADAAGFNFETYQQLRFGYEQAGISGAAFDKAIVKLNKNIVGGERGLATALDNFSDLGLNFEDLQKLTPEQRLIAVQDALNAIEDPGKKAALATQLLGKQFGSVSVDIDGVVEAGSDLIPITEEAARQAEANNDAFNELGTNLKNLATNALGPLVEPLSQVVEAFSEFAQEHPNLTLLGGALGLIGASVAIIGGPITLVTGAVLAAVVAWKNWDKIVLKVKQLWDAFGERFPIVQEIIEGAVKALKLPFDNLKSIFTGFFDGIQMIFSGNVVDGLKTIINGFINTIANAIEAIPIVGEDAAKSFREKFIFQLEETKADALDRSPLPDLVNGTREIMAQYPEIGREAGEGFRENLVDELNKAADETLMTTGDMALDAGKKLQSGLSSLGKHSKEAFEISKGLAISTAIVDTYRAFNAALECFL